VGGQQCPQYRQDRKNLSNNGKKQERTGKSPRKGRLVCGAFRRLDGEGKTTRLERGPLGGKGASEGQETNETGTTKEPRAHLVAWGLRNTPQRHKKKKIKKKKPSNTQHNTITKKKTKKTQKTKQNAHASYVTRTCTSRHSQVCTQTTVNFRTTRKNPVPKRRKASNDSKLCLKKLANKKYRTQHQR